MKKEIVKASSTSLPEAMEPELKKQVEEAVEKLFHLCNGLKVPIIVKWMDHAGYSYGNWSFTHPSASSDNIGWMMFKSIFRSFEECTGGKSEVIVRKKKQPKVKRQTS